VVQRIAAIVEETVDGSSPEEASNVVLTSSGMSAIFTALRLALACHQEMMTTMTMMMPVEVRSDDDGIRGSA
jgi:cystathionine beta-lyase/cystathionine gamma-synthase